MISASVDTSSLSHDFSHLNLSLDSPSPIQHQDIFHHPYSQRDRHRPTLSSQGHRAKTRPSLEHDHHDHLVHARLGDGLVHDQTNSALLPKLPNHHQFGLPGLPPLLLPHCDGFLDVRLTHFQQPNVLYAQLASRSAMMGGMELLLAYLYRDATEPPPQLINPASGEIVVVKSDGQFYRGAVMTRTCPLSVDVYLVDIGSILRVSKDALYQCLPAIRSQPPGALRLALNGVYEITPTSSEYLKRLVEEKAGMVVRLDSALSPSGEFSAEAWVTEQGKLVSLNSHLSAINNTNITTDSGVLSTANSTIKCSPPRVQMKEENFRRLSLDEIFPAIKSAQRGRGRGRGKFYRGRQFTSKRGKAWNYA